ncbi:MAG: FKBP-type peptidyl-prolyl cis-trans isomerase [Cyclobacteriaceae bacterium]|jgi:FKBP-type peptidyl-prolyl cis-trans isomerase FklB
MKQALMLLLIGCMACAQNKPNMDKEIKLDSEAKKASYAVGVVLAKNVKQNSPDSLDLDAVFKGFYDVWNEKKTQLTEQECQDAVTKALSAASERKSAGAKKAGEDFLAENAKKEGVKSTSSGLQYKVITAGSGKSPGPTSEVTVHYSGKLIDGTEFDSSYKRGEPATFPLNGVIPGWTEALQLMKEGDKWTIFIPQSLGYGSQGAGGAIPPFSTLVFDVELIKVK